MKQIPQIKQVNYPGLSDSEFYETGKKQFGDYPGAILTFSLGSKEQAFNYINKLSLIKRSTNIYDNKTLIIHPASTIFNEFQPELRETMGVGDSLLRLSPGIEDLEDLAEDIQTAFQ